MLFILQLFKPSNVDMRHCMLGCVRSEDMKEAIDFVPQTYKPEDHVCDGTSITAVHYSIKSRILIHAQIFSSSITLYIHHMRVK